MKHSYFWIVALLSLSITVHAQQTISGSFSPAKDYTWLIAYHLKPGSQAYTVDTKIIDGKFTLNMPANAKSGTYRMVYAIPQEEFYFDLIYNGKEDIELNFSTDEGLSFKKSADNLLLNGYFKKINRIEGKIIDFYKNKETNVNTFKKLTNELKQVQNIYLRSSENSITHNFIVANNPYIPETLEPLETYIAGKKNTYFSTVDFNDKMLQASSFLTAKVVNYAITALPLTPLSTKETQIEIQKNITTIASHLDGVNQSYSIAAYYSLWLQLAASEFNTASDYLYNNHLKSLATTLGKQDIITNIEKHNRLRIGTVAPEISWKEGKLSTLEGSSNYVLVFWSSTCSHCLRELPKLQEGITKNPKVKVIAVGLENDDSIWKGESAKLKDFTHAIALGKWDSDYAKQYAIQKTPTYFVLDKDKKIIANPEDYKETLSFLKETLEK